MDLLRVLPSTITSELLTPFLTSRIMSTETRDPMSLFIVAVVRVLKGHVSSPKKEKHSFVIT